MSPYPFEILKSLAWLAPLKTDQLQRIVAPGMSGKHFSNRLLLPMQQRGMIDADYLYTSISTPAKRQPPRRVGKVWALTAAGFAESAGQGRMPHSPAKVRLALLEHDLMISEVVTRMIEWSRPYLSGLSLRRLGRQAEYADAVLIVDTTTQNGENGGVPWSRYVGAFGQHAPVYLLNVDSDQMSDACMVAKAQRYRAMQQRATPAARIIMPVMVVPTSERLQRWQHVWRQIWPEGTWLITTEADLLRDQWVEFHTGRERLRTFVDGWQPGQDVPKNTTTSTPGAPGGPGVVSADPQMPRIIRLPDI
jgi:hypothetical protein